MNVLVLGGDGFIGSHISDRLLEEGHRIRIYSRGTSHRTPNVDVVVGDFLEFAKLTEALHDIDVVVHCISTTVPATSALNPEYDIQTNLVGTLRLLRIMHEQGVGKLVYLSSGGTVYGNPLATPVPESAPLNPVSSYGAVKVAIEKFIEIARMTQGLESVILRPSNPYGERQGHTGVQGLISTLLHNTLKKQTTKIYGDGKIIRDYIYVSDVADLVARSLSAGRCGIYNAGFGEGRSILQIIDAVKRATGEEPILTFSEPRGFDVKEIVLDSSLAHRHFGWKASMTPEEGIALHYSWLKKQYGRTD